MKTGPKPSCLREEDFLAFILKSHATGTNSYIYSIINYEIINKAVEQFLNFFVVEDSCNVTHHSAIIRKIFFKDIFDLTACCEEAGISKKTFYRYKQRYLRVFKSYLLQAVKEAEGDVDDGTNPDRYDQ